MTNETAFWIRVKGHEKFSDTGPELAFDELMAARSARLEAPIAAGEWTLTPDRKIAGTQILISIDGPYHWTKRQRRKDSWRDGALIALGYRVLHIDSPLLYPSQRYWSYVAKEVSAFISSTLPVGYLFA